MYSDDESQDEGYINYKLKYRELKKHLRALIYENECFQDELRKAQRNFVSISRDKTFLLDRILKYEKPTGVSSDSEATESSDEEEETKMGQTSSNHQQSFGPRKKITKRKRSETDCSNGGLSQGNDSYHMNYTPGKITKPVSSKPIAMKPVIAKKQKRPPPARKPTQRKERMISESQHLVMQKLPKAYSHMNERTNSGEEQLHMGRTTDFTDSGPKYEFPSEGQMTREDIERHLEARRFSPDLELNTTATVPAELFSPGQESDLEDSEICEFVQLDEDGTSADMLLE